MKPLQTTAAIAFLLLTSCKKDSPSKYLETNKFLFEKSKSEVLNFIKTSKPKLPYTIDTSFIRSNKALRSSIEISNSINLKCIQVKADSSLYYFLFPEEQFISSKVGHFSYKAESEIPLSNQKVIHIDKNWSYTERIMNIAD